MYSSRFVAMWPPPTATGERSIPYYSPASDRDACSELDHALRQQLEVLRGRRAVALHPAKELQVSGTKSYSPIPCSTRNVAEVSPPLITKCGRFGRTANVSPGPRRTSSLGSRRKMRIF